MTETSPRNVAVLGATGSIGRSALEVIAASEGRLRAVALSGHKQLEELSRLAGQHAVKTIVATDAQACDAHDWNGLPGGVRRLTGHEGLEAVVADPTVDIVLAAIVGSAGLRSTWAALEAGKTVALANKETLVMAGPLVDDAGSPSMAGQLIPVDSEHSAIFQALQCGRARRGAAGRAHGQRWAVPHLAGSSRLPQVTVAEALAHPTWDDGPEDHGRFGHDDEQGVGDHRGPLAVRAARPTRSRW